MNLIIYLSSSALKSEGYDFIKTIEEAIMKKNLYEPKFHGSTSIKKTLPVLAPDMSYEGLEISDGDSAMAVFGLMALGKYENREAKVMRKKLLDYCKQDTLAIVKLHERLVEYV